MGLLHFITNTNLLFGIVPEKIGLLVFGITLIVLAVGARRLFDRDERRTVKEKVKR